MPTITVLTASYNRAHTLPALYESLLNQSCYDFEWLIIDDGSLDNTEQVVKKLIQQKTIPIRYIYKANGGKHTALNEGIKIIDTELTVIVDSDDLLLPQAIETIIKYKNKYCKKNEISTFVFLKIYPDGRIIVPLDRSEFETSYIKYRIRDDRPGDMAEVFYTRVLKEFPFPEFENEFFLSEDIVWIEIGKKYKFLFVNKPVYQCNYLEDGLTKNDKRMKFASPHGSMLRGIKLMSKECGIKANIKGAIIYNCYKSVTTSTPLIQDFKLSIREKVMVILTKPLGRIFYYKWKPREQLK